MDRQPCIFKTIEPTEGHVASIIFLPANGGHFTINMTEQDAHDVINAIRAQLIANSSQPFGP